MQKAYLTVKFAMTNHLVITTVSWHVKDAKDFFEDPSQTMKHILANLEATAASTRVREEAAKLAD